MERKKYKKNRASTNCMICTEKPKIIFLEGDNKIIKEAVKFLENNDVCEAVLLSGKDELTKAMCFLKNDKVDGLIAGIDNSSRDVILAAKNILGINSRTETFSSIVVVDGKKKLILSDCAACKNPTAKQLADIAILANQAATKILGRVPNLAMLSFSTNGSGGHDKSICKSREAIDIVKNKNVEINIDGEMQLDAAINSRIASKKMPNSKVAGKADVLICPDLNSANILYKGIEQLSDARAYGPILLGFNGIVSDLSRGSTVEDVIGTTIALIKLLD